jgi:hypothetical protein
MTGGLMQLVGKGAQDQLVTGNPSFTHFRSVYKRHTEFAMEQFKLQFLTSNLSLPPVGKLTMKSKVVRNAQLLHDCYLNFTLPPIYSPVVPIVGTPPSNVNPNSTAMGYEFQWIRNIGYNMIDYVAITINGQEIVRHTGEWMKLYAALKFDGAKKEKLDEMTGNVPELYDPANTYGRINQYPHAIANNGSTPEPSIAGRVVTIPLHFWFCESVGKALPLIALQHSEIDIVVELKAMYDLFTVRDVRSGSSTYGERIRPDNASSEFAMSQFLSPPSTTPFSPVNSNLTNWSILPFIEANYIFLSDPELIHIAKTDHSFIINQIDFTILEGQYGPSGDFPILMKNLCSRVVWVAQRSDRASLNDFDNYTNWENAYVPPLTSSGLTQCYSSGSALNSSVSAKEILVESTLLIDGKDRFASKPTEFFTRIQNYKHSTGKANIDIPGIYQYSFALDHHTDQPSGHINGSMFNKIVLRNSYVQPPLNLSVATGDNSVCVLKNTLYSPNPTVINPNAVNSPYGPNDYVRIVRKSDAQTLQYSYVVRAYVESYNFLRVMGGLANVVFSS